MIIKCIKTFLLVLLLDFGIYDMSTSGTRYSKIECSLDLYRYVGTLNILFSEMNEVVNSSMTGKIQIQVHLLYIR